MITGLNARNFVENLRCLCESQRSISDVCRGMGMSRQQFNKYLSGQHLPSRHNLDLIAKHFLLSPEELMISPEVFAGKMSKLPGNHLKFLSCSQRFASYMQVIDAERAQTMAYCGVYERYHFSSIYAGHVLRSLVIVRECDGHVCHGYVERFPSRDQSGIVESTFKYHGFTSMIAGRLFMIDFETQRANEMTTTILVPRVRGPSPMLFGLTMGVAASLAREPFSTRVALRRISNGKLKVGHLRRATALTPDDATIPADIKDYLESNQTITRAADNA